MKKNIYPKNIGHYLLRGTIGEGAFSIVKLAFHEENHQYFACKIISRENFKDIDSIKRFEKEIRIHQQMNHQSIVKIIDLKKNNLFFFIIMEFCTSGELFQLIVDKNRLTETESRPIIFQILDAVNFIHKIGVVHRDIKPENILVDQTGKIKLSDFGLATFLKNEDNLVNTSCGSPCYASPECLSGNPYDGKKSDMWSIGVLLYATVIGQLPWTKRNQTELFKQIKESQYLIPKYISEDCQDLIKKLMDPNPLNRLTSEEALNHKWFNSTSKLYLIPNSNKFIEFSLKKVDNFFEKNEDFDYDFLNFEFKKNSSFINNSINKIFNYIKPIEKLPYLDYQKKNNILINKEKQNPLLKIIKQKNFRNSSNKNSLTFKKIPKQFI